MEDLLQAIWELVQTAYATTADMWVNHTSTMVVMLFVFAMAIIWSEARSNGE
jgi:hypothetical protein